MNVVDSSGWLEYFADGPNAKHYAASLEDSKNLIVPTISIYEVFKVVIRERGEDAALQAIALMRQGTEISLTGALAMLAAKVSVEHKLPMADSIIFSTAQAYQAVVWTQDEDFKHIKGVKYFPKQ